jgi:hypothetical protein
MSERGQATVEWAGLALLVSLVLGGLLATAGAADFGRPAHALGEAIVGRLAHPRLARAAARKAPGARAPAARAPVAGPPAGGPAVVRPPSLRYLARGVRPAWPPSLSGRTRRRVLRSLARAGEFGWFLCVGYSGLRNDFEHPRSPREFMSPDAVVDVLNQCLNPLEFLLP